MKGETCGHLHCDSRRVVGRPPLGLLPGHKHFLPPEECPRCLGMKARGETGATPEEESDCGSLREKGEMIAKCCGCSCGRCSHQGGRGDHTDGCRDRFYGEEENPPVLP